MRSLTSFWKKVAGILVVSALIGLALIGDAQAQNGTWTENINGFGNWGDTANWAGGTIADGANNTADFNTLDIVAQAAPFYYTGVGLDSARTIGHMIFGDTNTASPGAWEIFNALDPNPAPTLTLAGTTPSITVNPLGPVPTMGEVDKPAVADNAVIRVPVAGTAGLTKLGDGVLTLAGANTLTGAINVNAGTLRLGERRNDGSVVGGTFTTAPAINLADGATIETGVTVGAITIPTGGNATYRNYGGAAASIGSISAPGTGATLNVEFVTNAQVNPGGTWSGFQTVNLTGVTPGVEGNFRLSPNNSFGGAPPTGFNGASFATSHVHMDNMRILVRTNSQGNLIQIGELTGTSTAVLAGGNAGGGGSAARYEIGGNNTSTTFSGTIDGTGGLTINKIGAGTLTLAGPFLNSPAVNNTPARQGGVFRVTTGTLRIIGATSIPGGPIANPTILTTLDVLAGATFDVSGAPGTFATSSQQKWQGSGTILGNVNHAAGFIRAADVGAPTAANEDNMSAGVTPTAGTINFNGDLQFNGGAIGYDMTTNSASGNDLVHVTGTTALNSGTIIPNFLGAVPVGGVYTVLTSDGGFTGAASNLTVNMPGRTPDPVPSTVGNNLVFTPPAPVDPKALTWRGNVSGAWDNEITQNWVDAGAVAERFFEFDSVTFDDTATNTSVTIAAGTTVRPGPNAPSDSIVINANSNYSFTGGGAIVGSSSLTKTGTGNLTMQLPNTYTGPTSLSGGTIDIGTFTNAFGTGALTLSNVSLVATNTANVGMSNPSIAIPAGTSTSINFGGDPAQNDVVTLPTLTGDGTLTVTTSVPDKWYALNGLSGFTGTLNLTGVDTMMHMHVRLNSGGGGADLSDVVVNMNDTRLSNRQGGTAGAAATFEIGELHTPGNDTNTQIRAFEGGGTAVNANWQIGALNTNSDFAGVIIDNTATSISHVTKVGTGTLTLTGVNTYTGMTRVQAGTLSISNAYLVDSTDVALSTGAMMNLNFVGMDTIDSLFFDSVPQLTGTWGAIGSGAAHENAMFTGTGMLLVSSQPAAAFIGDYNGDGTVDAADYVVWRKAVGTATLLNRNQTNIGLIGAAEYNDWRAHFGETGPGSGAVAAVPEPASWVLAALALAVGCWRRRK